jgi:hypothetical protein
MTCDDRTPQRKRRRTIEASQRQSATKASSKLIHINFFVFNNLKPELWSYSSVILNTPLTIKL